MKIVFLLQKDVSKKRLTGGVRCLKLERQQGRDFLLFVNKLSLMTEIYHFDSGFRDWQATRKVISLEEFAQKFPDIYKDWELEQSPPECIFLYHGDHWILESEPRNFQLHIERDEWNEFCLEIQEMRLFLWCWEENVNP